MIEAPKKDDNSCSLSIQLEDNYLSQLTQSFRVHDFLCGNQDFPGIQFDLPQQFMIHTSTNSSGILGNNDGDEATFRTDASSETSLTHQSYCEKNPSSNQINTNPPDTIE